MNDSYPFYPDESHPHDWVFETEESSEVKDGQHSFRSEVTGGHCKTCGMPGVVVLNIDTFEIEVSC